MLICEYCNANFKTVSSLNLHKKSARYCLKKQQNKEVDKEVDKNKIFKCDYCDKNYTNKQNLISHYSTCHEKRITEFKEEYEKKLQLLETKYKLIEKQSEEYKQEIEKQKIEYQICLEKQKIEYEKRLDKQEDVYRQQLESQKYDYKEQIQELQNKLERLFSKAIDKPTTNTTNSNIISNNIELKLFLSQQEINHKISSKFTDKYLNNGMKDVANFIKNHILTLEDGSIIYACYDVSRQMFKYRDDKGNMVKDPNALKLINMIQPALLEQIDFMVKYFELNGDINNDEIHKKLHGKAKSLGIQISEMKTSQEFSKELAKITC